MYSLSVLGTKYVHTCDVGGRGGKNITSTGECHALHNLQHRVHYFVL